MTKRGIIKPSATLIEQPWPEAGEGPSLIATGIPELTPIVRAEGTHVSVVLRRLCIALGHYEESEEGPDQTRLEFGQAFEDTMAYRLNKAFPGRFVRLPELSRDNIFGNLDLFDVDDWAVVEVKLTWMSTNAHVESKKFWKYWAQAKTYAAMVDDNVTRVRLIVGHVMGDYDRSKMPQPVVNHWAQQFHPDDINGTWEMIRSHR